MRTFSAGNRAWALKTLPVRRWQARQWHIEMRTGSPSVESRSCSQLQAAFRVTVVADRTERRLPRIPGVRAGDAFDQLCCVDRGWGNQSGRYGTHVDLGSSARTAAYASEDFVVSRSTLAPWRPAASETV